MSEQLQITMSRGLANTMTCNVAVRDASLIGCEAKLIVRREVDVLDSDPVHHQEVIAKFDLKLTQRMVSVPISKSSLRGFEYEGAMINIKVTAEVVVSRGLLFSSKIKQRLDVGPVIRPRKKDKDGANRLLEPPDGFNFSENLAAIPPTARLITLVLAAIGAFIISVNTYVGFHDQFCVPAQTWIYSQRDSDGDRNNPLLDSLGTSSAMGAAVWYAMRQQLRRYMRFQIEWKKSFAQPGVQFKVSDLLAGVSRVPLRNVIVRIVAANMEHGEYMRGSGTNRRKVSFKEPCHALLVYEKAVALIPAGVSIKSHFDDLTSFDPVFKQLLPAQMVSKNHGLALHWEVQLLHSKFIDQELIGPTVDFKARDFAQISGAAEADARVKNAG